MEVMHDRVAGLDVHKETVAGCVRIMKGRKASRECRTFGTATKELEALLAWLTECGCTHVAMEATGVYWKPVWNILGDGAFELILANAAHIKNVQKRTFIVSGKRSLVPEDGHERRHVDRRSSGLRLDRALK